MIFSWRRRTCNAALRADRHRHGVRPRFALLWSLLLWLGLCATAHGYIIINAPMTDTNASGWVLGGNPTSAYLTGTGGSTPTYDPTGQGWLRLTNTQGNQTGFAYNTTSFDLSAGVLIQFDYASWGGSSPGADGASVFLFDGNVSNFNIGAFGGSLGYAQKMTNNSICNGGVSVSPAVAGISGGYVGIGLDEYGNYAACSEGRYAGWNNNSSSLDANTVSVRGPVTGFGGGAVGSTLGSSSYPWVYTSPSTTGYGGLYTSGGSSRPSQTGSGYRKVMIQISPAPNPTISVSIQFGYNTVPVQVVNSQPLPTISPSQTLKVGFAASTGALDNYHDVRNLLITTLGQSTSIDLGITKTAVSTGTTTQIANANVGTTFQYLLTATNNGPNDIYAPGVGVTDTFPANVSAGSWNCNVVSAGSSTRGATSCPNPASGTGNLNTAVNLTKGGSVAFTVNATVNSMPAGNALSNTARLTIPGAVSDYYSGNDSATSTITSYAPLVVTKSFSPSTVTSASTYSTMTVTLTNPNSIPATGVTFTDSYPTGLKNSTTPAISSTCGGTYTYGTGSPGSLKLTGTGNTVPANGSCSISIRVLGSTLGTTYTNTIAANAVDSTTSSVPNNATAATGTLTLMSPPTVSKSFAPNQVGTNVASQLSLTITNPNGAAITGAQFTDSYPTGLVNTGGQGGTITGTGCSGTVTAVTGSNSLALANGVIPANSSCTYATMVSAPTAGTYNNTTPALTTGNDGNVAAGANVPLTVLNPPTVTTSFASPGTILPNGTSVMTVTLTNPNGVAITGAGFSDVYPANLMNTAALNDATTCTGGTTTSTNTGNNGTSGTLTLSGATIPANGSCNVTITTTGATAGSYTNSTGAVTTTNAGTGASASGTLVVMAPLAVSKSFTPTSIGIGSPSVLQIVLSNPNSVAVTGAGYTDSYPTNMKNTSSPQPTGGYISGTGCTGTVTATATTGTSVKLASATVPANSSCTLSVNVTISADGSYTNTIPVGGVTTGNAGSNSVAASANLNGPQAPIVTEAFTDANLAAGADTGLTLTIGNTNSVPITLSSLFTDALPTGMKIKTAGNTGTCSGVTAAAGAASFTMASGTSIPVGGCTIVVNLTSTVAGVATDTIAAGDLQTSMGGNQTGTSATVNIYTPPTVTKVFNPSSISYGGTSTMTITVANPSANPGNLTGVAIADSYTGTLVNNAAATLSCSAGGSATLNGGSNGSAAVGFGSGTIPPGGSCTITQSVTATSTTVNTTAAPAATAPVPLSGTAAAATLIVAPVAPTVAVSLAADSIATGGTTSLTVSFGNGNAGAFSLTNLFTDTLPAGMTIANAGSTGTCGGVTASLGAGSFSIANGTSIPVGGCTVIVNVTSSTAGAAVDSVPVGALQTTAGNNTVAGSDTLNVYAAPTVAVAFSPASIPSGGTSTMTVTVSSPAANPGNLTGVSIADSYSGTLSNSAAGSVACSGGGSASLSGGAQAGTSVGFTGGTIVPGGSCVITQSVTATSNNTNTTGTPAATGPVALTGSAGSATLTTVQLAAPSVDVAFSPTQIEVSPGRSTLTVTLTNPSSNSIDIIGAGFSNSFPSGLVVASGTVVTSNCGGSTTVLSGNSGISLSGGRIPANGSCYVSAYVTSSSTGSYTVNVSVNAVSSANAASNTVAGSAKLVVATVAAPTVSTSFNQGQIGVNGNSVLTISIANSNVSVALNGVGFTDSLPGGVKVTSPSGLSSGSSCGAVATVAGDNLSLSLSGGTIPAGSTCTITVNVTSGSVGAYTNTVSVSTTNAGTGSASASLNVLQAPTVTVQFNPALTTVNNSAALVFTLYNPNSIAISGASFTDSYPSGLLNSVTSSGSCSASSSICTCQAGTVTAAASGASLGFSGGTIPGNATCTVSVSVVSGAAGSYPNSNGSVSVSTTNAGTASAGTATLIVSSTPTLSVVKTASPMAGKPRDVITYTAVVTNPSAGYAANVVLTDVLNPYSYWGVNSIQFKDGSTPSGLSLGSPILYDDGNGWGYAPGSGKGGAPANFDGNVTRWQVPMSGVMNPGSSFSLTYTIMIR